MLAFDPLANFSATEAHLVLGAQTSLWSEQTDGGTLDSVAWPRAAALTELRAACAFYKVLGAYPVT